MYFKCLHVCLTECITISLHDNRSRKALENRMYADDERLQSLDEQFKQAKYLCEEREQMYDEVCLLKE